MKTQTSLSALALAACVVASPAQEWDPLPKRDVATIQMVIQQATTALGALDTSVKAFNGADFQELATQAGNLKNVLTQGTAQITATSAITANDAITLQSSLSPVQSQAASLVTDLTSKKAQIQQASLCSLVQQQTTDIGTAAKGLIAATVMKVPAELQQVAGQLTGQFTGQLSDVSLQFAPGNCTDKAGGSASAAGITFSNSSASAGSTTTAKSAAAPARVAGAFGLVVAGAVGLLVL